MDHIVGMMWNKNEGDILEEIIVAALPHLDSLFVADDGSTDKSWEIIQSFKGSPKVEHIQQKPNKRDKAQRQSLLNEIRRRYKPEDTLVQIIESDIIIVDTDIRKAWAERSNGFYMDWVAVNAARAGARAWEGYDTYPNWKGSIKDIMPDAHYMEVMTYTFRPYPGLAYGDHWRPWPQGFSQYIKKEESHSDYTPILGHYGFRGPTHSYLKYKHYGKHHPRYPKWDLTSPKTVSDTVYYFNGTWNRDTFPMSREGWKTRKEK